MNSRKIEFYYKNCFKLIHLYVFELLLKIGRPYNIKSAVFAAFCLVMLKIVSCQFMPANHWSANTLELSSKVKVCGPNPSKILAFSPDLNFILKKIRIGIFKSWI